MPGTTQSPINPALLANAPQSTFLTTPRGTDPTVSATSGQLYQKGNAFFFQDTAGTITNLLSATSAVSNALGANTVAWPYGLFNASGPILLMSGASQNTLKGIIAHQSGSIVGAFAIGNAPSATSGNIVVYKNNAVFFTALTGLTMQTAAGLGVPKYASFANGAFPFAAGDALDLYYTNTGTGLYVGAGLIVNFGNLNANALSTSLSANTTLVATDNQRVWQASMSTQYTLTLPATNAAQDFYTRAVVTAGGGVKFQAPAGVTIYRGASSSTSGGSFTVTQLGTYVTLYNPAGSNIWVVMDQSAAGALA